ncbi:endolytic transglycosylase MltG [Bacillus salitolerans]|uniref:Endolytic murein transglycosylase n=1 Tax=Bacillus salitolerans TaxID=1437434 RepID=A0ABW4LNQ5_9BACI
MFSFDSDDDKLKQKLLEKHQEARIVRRIVLIISLIIFLLIGGGIAFGYSYIKSALQPVDPTNSTPIDVTVPMGSSPTKIANILQEHGIVKNAKIFKYYIKFKNEGDFQAGEYKLNQSMTFEEIIASLKTGKVIQEAVFSLTIPEGKHLEQIAKIIHEKVGHSEEDIMNKLNDIEYLKKLVELYPSILTDEIFKEGIRYPLEGYLYPATYSFYKANPSIEEIIQTMLDKTEEIVSSYQDGLAEKEMTVHELLTLASLIEEEATGQTDREKISSVFYNRMDINMPLQTDPTVLYALGEHKDRVLYVDLEVESPYNTYIIQGLPIGPIANAGEMSIKAALYPAETNFLYFLATKEGEVIFTKSLEEHNREKAKHIQ